MNSLEQYKGSRHYRKIYEQIETLGLAEHINHLDEYGYAVIPPELVAPEEFQDRLQQAVLDVNERRTGQKINLKDIETAKHQPGCTGWRALGTSHRGPVARGR